MEPENNDANTGTEDQGSSPEVEILTPTVDEDGLIGTVEFDRVEPEKDDQTKDLDTSEGAEQDTPASPKTPYHEDPRFQELIAERNAERTARTKLEGRLEALEKGKPAEQQDTAPNRFEGKSDEELLSDFTTNPKGFLADFANAVVESVSSKSEAEKTANEQKSFLERQDQTFEDFFKGKEGELQKLVPEMKKLMSEKPGHNAISAYLEITRETRMESALKTARKEEREKVLREFKVGKIAQSASSGTQTPAPRAKSDHMLKNPDKYGGTENVLLKRFQEREGR